MSFTYNGNTPSTITYNGNDIQTVTYNGVTVWQKYQWNSWSAGLTVNGSSSSSTSASCYLSWNAASTTPASTITYHVMFNNIMIATTSNTYYSVPASYSNGVSGATCYIIVYSDKKNSVLMSGDVYYTYKNPSTTISATGSRTNASGSVTTNNSTIYAKASGSGYAGYTFAGNSAFSSFTTARLYVYITGNNSPSTLTMIVRNNADSWYYYSTGWGNSFTATPSFSGAGWLSVNITEKLNTLISDVGSSAIVSNGLKVYFRSSNNVAIASYSSSNPAYIILS